jgi:homoserine/homoserine lactone efflux protein
LIDLTLISLFIPTFLLVSITPGLCMTLAMTLGMSIGIRRTLWMMAGEVLGVATVAIAAVLGVAAIVTKTPQLFIILKVFGAAYLAYVGVQMWRSKSKLSVNLAAMEQPNSKNRLSLFNQGYVTAIANPKGWAFMISLLPPFINKSYALPPQLIVLVGIIMISEFICMLIYAVGGKSVARLLSRQNNEEKLNQISGSLMILVAIWLLLS